MFLLADEGGIIVAAASVALQRNRMKNMPRPGGASLSYILKWFIYGFA